MEWRLPESEEPSGQGPCSASHSLYRVLDPGLVLFKSPNVVTDRSSYGDMPSNADAALLGKLGYQAKKTGVYRYIYVYIYIYIYIYTHTHTHTTQKRSKGLSGLNQLIHQNLDSSRPEFNFLYSIPLGM